MQQHQKKTLKKKYYEIPFPRLKQWSLLPKTQLKTFLWHHKEKKKQAKEQKQTKK